MCTYNVRHDSLKHQFVSRIFILNGKNSDPISVHAKVRYQVGKNNNAALGHSHLKIQYVKGLKTN